MGKRNDLDFFFFIFIFELFYCKHICGSVVQNLPARQEIRVQLLGQKISWRRKWQPTPIFSPGKSQGQRSLAGYSP